MRIITVAFDYNGSNAYARMLRVYEYTVRQRMPAATFEVIRIAAPNSENKRQRSFVSNTFKLREWVRILTEADPSDQIVLTDCDMMMVGDLSDAFDNEFDIAYTRRRAKLPMNGGVVFARPTEKAVQFFQLWGEWNERFYRDPAQHRPWRTQYGGMNQAALGKILCDVNYDATVIALPCEIYNAIDSDWGDLTDNCRMIHCKSNLRKAIFSRPSKGRGTRFTDKTLALAEQWHRIEREVTKCESSV